MTWSICRASSAKAYALCPPPLPAAQAHQEHLGQMLAHLDSASVAEALVRVLGADEQCSTFMPPGELAWLSQTDVLQVRGALAALPPT